MSTLDEAAPAIRAAAGPPGSSGGRPVWGGASVPSRAVLAAFLGRSLGTERGPRALEALVEAGLADPATLAESDPAELEAVLTQGGVASPSRALGPLRKLAGWLAGRGVDLDDVSTEQLREELRALNGIGPASADGILLEGLGRPAYPVDRATYRILVRHGWIDPTTDYDEARDAVERLAPDDPVALAQLARGMEQIGRSACRAAVARCERCPLRPFLPEGGPIASAES